jgi:NAD(P)H-dependent flavin oxidoreductase YrpB (nitropropane dioxygenase family)
LRTRVTTVLGIEHPVLSAGMGPHTNVELVAAVSEAGGLGILAATALSDEEIHHRVAELRARTARPFGLNLLLPFSAAAEVEACLAARVPVLSTAWGDPTAVAARARTAGIPLVHMVTTAAHAVAAARAGVAVVAAQGNEAGGGLVGPVGTLPLIPAALDAIAVAAWMTGQQWASPAATRPGIAGAIPRDGRHNPLDGTTPEHERMTYG